MCRRLGILLSGNGSTYANLVERIVAGAIPAEVAVVVSSRPDAYGLERAAVYGHRTAIAAEPDAVSAHLRDAGCDLVAMCGWMRYYDPPADLRGRVVNIHPSLIPAFCGRGMYGRRVHRAVLAKGVKVSGCTVHVVEGPYDTGPILAQRVVPVLADDDPSTLEARVQAAERHLYPLVVTAMLRHDLILRAVSGVDAADFGFLAPADPDEQLTQGLCPNPDAS